MGPGEAWAPPELGCEGQRPCRPEDWPSLFTPGAITSPAWVPPGLEPMGSKAQHSTAIVARWCPLLANGLPCTL